MMDKLKARGEQLAHAAQKQCLDRVALQLRALFGDTSVAVEDVRAVVSGRGLLKRWLADPRLRFMGGGLK